MWTIHACMLSPFSCFWLFVTLWTISQAPLSMGFSRQEYWSGLLCPPPGDLPDPGIEPEFFFYFLHWQMVFVCVCVCVCVFLTTSAIWEAQSESVSPCLWAKFSLIHIFVNKVLLGCRYIHSFAYVPWLFLDNNSELSSATRTLWLARLNTFNIWCFNKVCWHQV